MGKNVLASRSDGTVFSTGDKVIVENATIIRILPDPDDETGHGDFCLLSLTNEQQGPAIIIHVDSLKKAEEISEDSP